MCRKGINGKMAEYYRHEVKILVGYRDRVFGNNCSIPLVFIVVSVVVSDRDEGKWSMKV